MQFTAWIEARDDPVHARTDLALCPDACRHLARPVLPARLAARGRRRARRGADRRDRRVRPAAGRRRGRRQHADQQGGDRVALGAARLRRRLPVRPGRRRPASRSTRGPTAATCCRAWRRSPSSRAWSPPHDGETTVRVFNVNTRSRIDVTVQTPGRPRPLRRRAPASTAWPAPRRRSSSTSSTPGAPSPARCSRPAGAST